MTRMAAFPSMANTALAGGLTMLGAVDEVLPAGLRSSESLNPRLVMLLTHSGTCRLTIDGRELEHLPGRLVVSAAGVRFSAEVSARPWRARYLMLDGPWAKRLSRGLRRRPGACWLADPAPPAMAAALVGAVATVQAQRAGWDLMVLAPLGLLIAAITAGLDDGEDELVARLAALVDEHPDRTWRLALLAAAIGVSVPILTHRVRAATGLAPASWVRHRRCMLAQRLLSAGHGVGETAAALGFAEAAHFSRQFHALTGQWPSAWRTTAGLVSPSTC